MPHLSELLQDARLGVRMLRKRPGTSALAVLALALGIGLTTAMFSIVQGAFLRGLPVPDGDKVVSITRWHLERGNVGSSMPVADYLDLRSQQRSFTDIAAAGTTSVTIADDTVAAERFDAGRVSVNLLDVLSVAPVAGRGFVEADEVVGAPDVVLIREDVWRRRYDSSPSVLGSPVRVNGVPMTLVGVLPEDFGFPNTQSVWLPLRYPPTDARNRGQSVRVIGRLRPGVTMDEATRDVAAVAGRLAAEYPENEGYTALTQTFMEGFLGSDVISTLLAMLGAVFGVLLIACANVTNLQLARAADRIREVAVRSALGAGRWRIVRQMIVESLLLASVGAVFGIVLAAVAIALFNRGIADTDPPFWIDIKIDTTVLLFVMAITGGAAIISSVWPAMRVSRTSASEVLKDEGRSGSGLRAGIVTRLLVTVSVAISCGLLIVSGLMIKSVAQLAAVDYSFETASVLEGRISLLGDKYPESGDVERFLATLHERVLRLPGVAAAALASGRPGPGGGGVPLLMADEPIPAEDEDVVGVRRMHVTPRFFDTVEMELVAGRDFTSSDVDGATRVVIVDESIAATHFPGGALGRQIRLGRTAEDPLWTIVGVAPVFATPAEDDDVVATAWVPIAQQGVGLGVWTYLRANGEPELLAQPLRRAVMDLDRDAALYELRSLEAALYQQGWPSRVFGGLFMSFGLAALVMATAGLYGVLAFAVRRRTPEIGLRMALGAGRGEVLRLILKQGVWYVGLGLIAGTAIGYFLAPLMGELLWRVEPRDLTVFGVTIGSLALTGFIACLVPALRAASVDPLVALRHE